MIAERPVTSNWHNVVLLACLAVAVELAVLREIARRVSPKGRIVTIFEPQGRDYLRDLYRRAFGIQRPPFKVKYVPLPPSK